MRILPLFLLLPALAGCDQNMVHQPRADDYGSSPIFADGKVLQAAPDGTVARDMPLRDAAAQRPPMSMALIERGRERYQIFCVECHGVDGRGDGVVVARGFPAPPSYLEPRLRAMPSAYFYGVITNGYGVMYSYAGRVPPADRWAIAAYIRALQQAGSPASAHAH